MTETSTTREELMGELRLTPWGAAHRELANRIIALAQERDDDELEFDARQQLVEHGVMKGATDLALANFAWCAAKYEERPTWFADRPGRAHDFFWQHKWMPNRLSISPAFSVEQIRDVLDEMDTRFQDAGLGRSAVVTARFEAALHLCDFDEAQRWGDELRGLPEDDYSSCSACTPGDYVDLALGQGEEVQAVDLAVKTWRDDNSCVTEPGRTLAAVLVAMLRQGRVDDAVEAFEQVRDDLDTQRDQVGPLAQCAQFASLTGNHDLALGLLERHLGWMAQDPLDEDGHFIAAMSFAVVLDRAVRALEGTTVVVRASTDPALVPFLGEVAGPLTATETASALWSVAEDLAAQFDERNGTDHYAQSLAQSRALVDEDHPVQIEETELFAPITVAVPSPTTATEWWTRALAAQYAQDQHAAAECAGQVLVLADDSQDGLLLRWNALQIRHSVAAGQGDPEAEERAASEWTTFAREAFGADGEKVAVSAIEPSRGDALAEVATSSTTLPVLLRSAVMVAAASALGDGATQASAEDIAEVRARLDQAEELLGDAPTSESEVAQIRAVVTRTAIHLGRAILAVRDDQDPNAALEHLSRIDGQLAPALSDAIDATASSARGRVLYTTGDLAATAKAHEVAATAFSRCGFWSGAHREAVDAAQLRLWNGEGSEALARIEYALSLRPVDEPTPSGLRWLHALALLAAGEADRALPVLETLLAEQREGGAPADTLARTHMALGEAYGLEWDDRSGDHYGDAAEQFSKAGMYQDSASASIEQANTLQYTVGLEAALAALERAEASAHQVDDPRLHLLILVTRADFLIDKQSDGWRQAAELAIALVRTMDDPAREVDVLGRLSEACVNADNVNGAIEFREQQIAAVRRTGDSEVLVDAVTDLAYELRAASRSDEAYAVLAGLWNERESLNPEALAMLVQYSESIMDSQGRTHEWETWKAQLN